MAESNNEWELSKENIKTIPSGRLVDALNSALKCSEKIDLQKKAFERDLRTYSGNDPLSVWYNYFEWAVQIDPTHSFTRELVKNTVLNFFSDNKYKDDHRFVRLCALYAVDFPEPVKTFELYYRLGIGRKDALMYKTFANQYEKIKDYKKADHLYREGIALCDNFKEFLIKRYDEFQVRMIAYMKMEHEEMKTEEEESQLEREVLGSLQGVGKENRAPHLRVTSQGPGQLIMTQAGSLSHNKNKKIEIMNDENFDSLLSTPSEHQLEQLNRNKEIFTSSRLSKENTQNPSKWSKCKMKQKLIRKQGEFEIYQEDLEPQSCQPIVPGASLVLRNHYSERDNKLLETRTPSEATCDPNPIMYPIKLAFCGLEEYSIEELKALEYLDKKVKYTKIYFKNNNEWNENVGNESVTREEVMEALRCEDSKKKKLGGLETLLEEKDSQLLVNSLSSSRTPISQNKIPQVQSEKYGTEQTHSIGTSNLSSSSFGKVNIFDEIRSNKINNNTYLDSNFDLNDKKTNQSTYNKNNQLIINNNNQFIYKDNNTNQSIYNENKNNNFIYNNINDNIKRSFSHNGIEENIELDEVNISDNKHHQSINIDKNLQFEIYCEEDSDENNFDKKIDNFNRNNNPLGEIYYEKIKENESLLHKVNNEEDFSIYYKDKQGTKINKNNEVEQVGNLSYKNEHISNPLVPLQDFSKHQQMDGLKSQMEWVPYLDKIGKTKSNEVSMTLKTKMSKEILNKMFFGPDQENLNLEEKRVSILETVKKDKGLKISEKIEENPKEKLEDKIDPKLQQQMPFQQSITQQYQSDEIQKKNQFSIFKDSESEKSEFNLYTDELLAIDQREVATDLTLDQNTNILKAFHKTEVFDPDKLPFEPCSSSTQNITSIIRAGSNIEKHMNHEINTDHSKANLNRDFQKEFSFNSLDNYINNSKNNNYSSGNNNNKNNNDNNKNNKNSNTNNKWRRCSMAYMKANKSGDWDFQEEDLDRINGLENKNHFKGVRININENSILFSPSFNRNLKKINEIYENEYEKLKEYSNSDPELEQEIMDNSVFIDTDNPYNDLNIKAFIQHLDPPLSSYPGYHSLEDEGLLMPSFKLNSVVKLGNQRLIVKNILGEGGFGKAMHFIYAHSNQDIVAKIQKPSCPWEFYISKEFHRRFDELLKEEGGCDMQSSVMMISEAYFYKNGSLFLNQLHQYGTLLDLINEVRCKKIHDLPQWFVMILCLELVCIVHALHKCSIVHGDLKPDNILIKDLFLPEIGDKKCLKDLLSSCLNGNLFLKIIDLGQSIDMSMFPPGTQFTAKNKKKDFQCIQMKTNKPWSYELDLYGLAGLMYLLMTNKYMNLVQNKNHIHFNWSTNLKVKRDWTDGSKLKDILDRLINTCSSSIDLPSLIDFFKIRALEFNENEYLKLIQQLKNQLKKN